MYVFKTVGQWFETREFVDVNKVGNAVHHFEEGNSLDNVGEKNL